MNAPAPLGARGGYPKRERYFACHFVRAMTKKCVANDLGPQAFTLLAVIAMTEDARGYTDAVSFFNEQLLPLIGAGSVDSLDRVRKKCVAAGWLHYVPGGRRIGPGRYWVTIPEPYRGTDDAPTDETADDPVLLPIHAEQNAEQTAAQDAEPPSIDPQPCGAEPEQDAEQTASKPRNLLPVPVPVPKHTADAGGVSEPSERRSPGGRKGALPRKRPGEDDPTFCEFYRAYPLKEDRPAAWKAWQKIKPDAELAAVIMAGLKRYKATKPEWQNWKQPGPWLNARRWEDEPASTAAPPPELRRLVDFDMELPARSDA